MRADFYQLAGAPVERVLPKIAERVLSNGQRLLVVADNSALLARLDETLWSYAPAGFLPHALDGEEADAEQPILLSARPEPANAATHIALADGIWREAALGFERAFLLFGADALQGARDAWRRLADEAGVERHFWKQDEHGKWVEGP